MKRSLGASLAVAIALTACSEAEAPPTRAAPAVREVPFPYPFTTPTPPQEATPLDGRYERDVPDERAGPVGVCKRCPPYRLELGDSNTLVLSAGVFRVANELTGWGSVGHFVIEGDRLELFNDPNCPADRGVYRWGLADGLLSFELVADDCAFAGLRGRYLTASPWARR